MGFYRYTLFHRVLFAAVEFVIYCKFKHEVTVFSPRLKYIYIMIKRSVYILLISTITLISIFLPSTMLTYDFKISNRETNSAHLSLLNERDIKIKITFPCNTAKESPNWIIYQKNETDKMLNYSIKNFELDIT